MFRVVIKHTITILLVPLLRYPLSPFPGLVANPGTTGTGHPSWNLTQCQVTFFFWREFIFFSKTTLFFLLYIIYWVVGVSPHHVSDHRERCPRSWMTWSDTYTVEVSTTWRPLSHTEDNVRICWTSFRQGHGWDSRLLLFLLFQELSLRKQTRTLSSRFIPYNR